MGIFLNYTCDIVINNLDFSSFIPTFELEKRYQKEPYGR